MSAAIKGILWQLSLGGLHVDHRDFKGSLPLHRSWMMSNKETCPPLLHLTDPLCSVLQEMHDVSFLAVSLISKEPLKC